MNGGIFQQDIYTNINTCIYFANVIDIDDKYDGCRIKARILGQDDYKSIDDIPYAFPLLPKHVQIKPKINECVLIFLADLDRPNGIRFYIGPLISQPQFLYKDTFELGATSLLPGSIKTPLSAVSNDANCKGILPKDDDVAILGRKNSDIILSNDDLRIRCGVKSVDPDNMQKMSFNKEHPSFIKLKLHGGKINKDSYSSATVVADEINLISNVSQTSFTVTDSNEQITDDVMREIIKKAHPLPYGDNLVDFLVMFLQMFKSHTHKYANMPPCPDEASQKLGVKYGSNGGEYTKEDFIISDDGINETEIVERTFSGLQDKLLSKNVRIN